MKQRLLQLLTLALIGLPLESVSQITRSNPTLDRENIVKYQTPYFFIENKGQIVDQNHQTNSSVLYQLALPGMNVSLKKTGFSYDCYAVENSEKNSDLKGLTERENDDIPCKREYKFHRIDVDFLDVSSNCIIEAVGKSTDYSVYYTPGTPEDGAQVFHYKKVYYRNLYEGIDLEFLASPGTSKPVEYNFIVHPGANVAQIKMRYSGALQSALKEGSLVMKLAHTELTESIPASWIEESQKSIAVGYLLLAQNVGSITLGFSVGSYKSNNTLIIDPTPKLNWGTYYGGEYSDEGMKIALDASGNVLAVGWTYSLTNIASTGAHQFVNLGYRDVFIVKFNSAGTRLWGTYYGGVKEDRGYDIAADMTGNVYAVGYTYDSISLATKGAHQTVNAGGYGRDVFIVKFNSSGIRQWGTFFGGNSNETGRAISIDKNGSVYVCGTTGSTGLATAGAYQTTKNPDTTLWTCFLTKFSSTGTRLWCTYYNGYARDVAVDTSGNVLITGTTTSSSGVATTGAHKTVLSGYDAFLVKFNSSGVRQWGSYYGGPDAETGESLTIDEAGDVFIVGSTMSYSGISTPGTHAYNKITQLGAADGFVAKFKSTGTLAWGTYYSSAELLATTTDILGNVVVAGGYEVAQFNSAGIKKWSINYFNGGADCNGVVMNSSGYLYVTGTTEQSLLISTPGSHQEKHGSIGLPDAFVACYTTCSKPTITVNPSNVNSNQNQRVQFVVRSSVSNVTYQWQIDTGSGFKNLVNGGQFNGVNNDTLLVTNVTQGNNGYKFRCVLFSALCADTSKMATLLVCTSAIANQPIGQSIKLNDVARFIVSSADPSAKYQWQTDFGTGFQNLNNVGQYSGVKDDTLVVSNVSMSNNNQPFRCIVSSANCTDTSKSAFLTVNQSTGNRDVAKNLFLSVFPNPTEGTVYIKVDKSFVGNDFVIYDNSGKVILSGKLSTKNTKLELNTLSNGIYWLRVGTNHPQIVQLIKK